MNYYAGMNNINDYLHNSEIFSELHIAQILIPSSALVPYLPMFANVKTTGMPYMYILYNRYVY